MDVHNNNRTIQCADVGKYREREIEGEITRVRAHRY